MSPTPDNKNDSPQAQVEALIAAAKKHSAEGKELEALDAYKTASALMLGAPWLQLRTAELARKQQQPESATVHYRRAAAAFIRAGFPKRALGPLRAALQVSASLLPREAAAFITVAIELSNAQRELGLNSEAKAVVSNANSALRDAGSTERVTVTLELGRGSSLPPASNDLTQNSEASRNDSGPAPSLGEGRAASAAER